MMGEHEIGKVWLIGSGPGDPGLMTIKGLEALTQAQVVVYDALIGEGIGSMIPEQSRQIYVGKRSGAHEKTQEEINQILLEEAQKGNRVVRLKGGDPFVFGRGGEELELLVKNNIPFEIVPGITSAIAVPAYNGIPVTHRGLSSSLHIITGHSKTPQAKSIDYEALSRLDGTLVFLMGLAALPSICQGLAQAGMDLSMPAAVLEQGTTSRQRKVVASIGTLAQEADKNNIAAPAIIIVGRTCTLSDTLGWREKKPLWNKKILVTRPKKQASAMTARLLGLGAEVIELPAIETKLVEDVSRLEEIFTRLQEFKWLVVTSPSGVHILMDYLRDSHKDIRVLFGLKLACVGTETEKAFLTYGLRVEYLPDQFNSCTLGEGLIKNVHKGEKVLILRSSIGGKELIENIKKHGMLFEEAILYDTIFAAPSPQGERIKKIVRSGNLDYIIFTSRSTVKGFLHTLNLEKDACLGMAAVCIGEQTAKEARKLGMVCFVPQEATMESMTALILSKETIQ